MVPTEAVLILTLSFVGPVLYLYTISGSSITHNVKSSVVSALRNKFHITYYRLIVRPTFIDSLCTKRFPHYKPEQTTSLSQSLKFSSGSVQFFKFNFATMSLFIEVQNHEEIEFYSFLYRN